MTHSALLIPAPALRAERAAPFTQTIATAAGPVSVWIGGTGAPLLFVGEGPEGHGWDAVAVRLTGRFLCVVPDAAGRRATAACGEVSVIEEILWATGLRDVTLVADPSSAALEQVRLAAEAPAVVGLRLIHGSATA